jgi:large subunit ribosomal protein L27e
MGKFLKYGKVVILTNGRYAGAKAVVIKVYENGVKDMKFSHVLVAGISRYPRKVTKKRTKKI